MVGLHSWGPWGSRTLKGKLHDSLKCKDCGKFKDRRVRTEAEVRLFRRAIRSWCYVISGVLTCVALGSFVPGGRLAGTWSHQVLKETWLLVGAVYTMYNHRKDLRLGPRGILEGLLTTIMWPMFAGGEMLAAAVDLAWDPPTKTGG
jgi:hypothetical protein